MRAAESRKGPRGFGEPTGGAEGSLALPWHLPYLQRNLHPCADKKEPFKKVTQKTLLALKAQCDRNTPVPKQTPVHACVYGSRKARGLHHRAEYHADSACPHKCSIPHSQLTP